MLLNSPAAIEISKYFLKIYLWIYASDEEGSYSNLVKIYSM